MLSDRCICAITDVIAAPYRIELLRRPEVALRFFIGMEAAFNWNCAAIGFTVMKLKIFKFNQSVQLLHVNLFGYI